MNQLQVDEEFRVLSRQFNRRVDAGRPGRHVNPLTVVAVVLLVEVALVLAVVLFG